MNFALRRISILRRVLLAYCEILRHGTDGFPSPPNEGVLWIFIAVKNPSPRPGLNPQNLGLMASMLTTRPLRMTILMLLSYLCLACRNWAFRQRIFLSPLSPDLFWGPSSLLSNGYRRYFLGGKARQGHDVFVFVQMAAGPEVINRKKSF
jgi:hypothetical protein